MFKKLDRLNMSEFGVVTKKEFDDSLQCLTCLSFGRKMLAVGNHASVFRTLVADFFQIQHSLEDTLICWECHSILRRFDKFRNQVRRASQLIQCGQSHLYNSLSCLTTVVKIETGQHIPIDESNITVKQEDFVKQSPDEDCTDSPFIEWTESCADPPDDSFVKVGITEPSDDSYVKVGIIEDKERNSIQSISKWMKKRALEKKKAKFKILKANDVNVNMVLKKSLKSKHKEKLDCSDCNLRFTSEDLLMEHFKCIHKKEIACDVCFLLVTDKEYLLAHLESHAERYECKLCDFVCNTKIEGKEHLVKIHTRIFKCVHCELIFASRPEFFIHYRDWHEKYICDYCGVSFKMRYSIEDHIRRRHSPYECKLCDKRFRRYNGLWLHNKLKHTTIAQSQAYCVECDKRYPDMVRYKWHLNNSVKHTPKKKVRIPCPECDKIFSKNINMKEHYDLIHLKLYKYRCQECDKNFIRNADLVRHKKRLHEGILPPKNKICYMCGRGFSTNKILTNHIRTHTGERPFACGSCPARFAQRVALVTHTRALHHSGT